MVEASEYYLTPRAAHPNAGNKKLFTKSISRIFTFDAFHLVEDLLTLGDWLSAATTLLGCYLILRLKAFLQARFAARGLDWPVWLSILLSVALELTQLYWGDSALTEYSVPSFTYFGLLALLGLTMLWLGIMLLKVENAYPALRVLAWLNMAGGVLAASIILLVVAVLPMLAAMVATALVFFRGARELSGTQAA